MDTILSLAEEFEAWEVLRDQDRQLFESSGPIQIQQELNSIQSIQNETRTLRGMFRIKMFLDGLLHLEKVLQAVGFHHTNKVMMYVWGPLQYLLRATHPTDDAFDCLLDAYEQLGSNMIPLYQYTQLFLQFPESEECLLHIYQDVIMFHRQAYKLFSLRPKIWQQLYKPTWKSWSRSLTHLSNSLDCHGKFVQTHGEAVRDTELTLDDNQGSLLPNTTQWQGDLHQTKAEFHRYRADIVRRRSLFADDEKDSLQKSKESVLAWISASKNNEAMHHKFQDMRRICPGTCRWLFQRYSEISDWIEEEKPPESAIWLQGTKGFGKSVLASALIDELKALSVGNKKNCMPNNTKIYYFYCVGEDPEQRTFIDVLKGLLHQMVESNHDLLPLCVEKTSSAGSTILSSPEVARSLVASFFEYNPRQYVVIDGLDECAIAAVRQITEFLGDRVQYCDSAVKQGQLRLVYISQPLDELLNEGLLPEDDACVQLRSGDNADDIRAYVQKRIPDFSKQRAAINGFNLSESDQEQIKRIICVRSEDMFLYAHLAIEYLLQQPTKGILLEKIREEILPKKLATIYGDLLGTIKEQLLQMAEGDLQWQMAKRLLSWLCCAKRPLRWHEMQSILSYDPDLQRVDFDNQMLRQRVRTYLGSLVHILDGGHIRLIHFTARKYLVQTEHIDEKEIQCELMILCLRYLSLPWFSNIQVTVDRNDKARLGWFSFQDYACSQWQGHVITTVQRCSTLFCDVRCGPAYQQRFHVALNDFIKAFYQDLALIASQQPEAAPSELDTFADFSFYSNLGFLWKCISSHQASKIEIRNTVGIAQIDSALQTNRDLLEKFTPDSIAWVRDTILDYYGPNLFKCKRTLCKFFYIGFDRKKDRDVHIKRHDRPYTCPFNCDMDLVGFSSNKELERHVRNNHPQFSEGPSEFTSLTRQEVAPGSTKFSCSICPKHFTRNINLRAHERSHFGERPFACSHCGKKFTRINDCRRHERIHLRRDD